MQTVGCVGQKPGESQYNMRWSLVYSVFKTLSLAHLERSLYSLSRQTVKADQMILFDNNSGFSEQEVLEVIQKHFDLSDWTAYFCRHIDSKKTLSWANNHAIRLADYDTFIFCRADFIYDFTFFEKMLSAFGQGPLTFASSWIFWMEYLSRLPEHLVDHAEDLEPLRWREDPKRLLLNTYKSTETRFSDHDGPSFCTTQRAMELAGWYDEKLYGWGFDQQDLQQRMIDSGITMKIVEEVLYYHMFHLLSDGERDLAKAKRIWDESRPKRQQPYDL